MIYSKNTVRTYYDELMSSSYQSVHGVVSVDSGSKGPTMIVGMGTHGNEPVGILVYAHMKEYLATHPLLRGRVIFVLVNDRAMSSFLSSTTEQEERGTRFIDINMNRLPPNSHRGEVQYYEQERLRALYPILSAADIAIDLHSTSLPSEPMVMALGNTSPTLLHALPIERVITHVEECMGDIFLMSYVGGYGSGRAETVGIECGPHCDPRSVQRGIEAVMSVMNAYEMLEGVEVSATEQRYMRMYEQIFFPNMSYALVRDFANFEKLPKGTCIARGDGDDIVLDYDAYSIFAFKGGKPPSVSEAALFLLVDAEGAKKEL